MAALGEEREDVAECVAAGRFAAFEAFRDVASRQPDWTFSPSGAPWNGTISVNNVDITEVIDAVVIETMVRIEHPDRVKAKPRAWWRFWR